MRLIKPLLLGGALILSVAVMPSLVQAQTEDARIVVTGGTLTDVVFAVGGEDRVVAVDSSSLSPAHAQQQKAVVGYYRDLSAEGVLSVQPTHLWALEGTGAAQTLRQLERSGVVVEHFSKPASVAELMTLIDDVGARLQLQTQARQVMASIDEDLNRVSEAYADEIKRQVTGLFILQVSERGIVAAGRETVPGLLFDYAQVTNLVDHEGYKPVSSEYLAVSQPDFLVAPSHMVEAVGGRQPFCAQSSLRLLNAARSCDLLVLDSLFALGMTTRIAEAIEQVYVYAYASPSA